MCWPLSSAPGASLSERARPPGRGAMSRSVTAWPACVARTAAANPAQPAPITATFIARSGERRRDGAVETPSMPAPLRPARDPELAQGRERDALVQDLELRGLDLAQQLAIDVGHHERGL